MCEIEWREAKGLMACGVVLLCMFAGLGLIIALQTSPHVHAGPPLSFFLLLLSCLSAYLSLCSFLLTPGWLESPLMSSLQSEEYIYSVCTPAARGNPGPLSDRCVKAKKGGLFLLLAMIGVYLRA